jgi:hypothetical protein
MVHQESPVLALVLCFLCAGLIFRLALPSVPALQLPVKPQELTFRGLARVTCNQRQSLS